jgi:hypothetical protein
MRIIAGLIAMLLLAACTDKDRLPSGIIEKDKMGQILWDMMEADQYASIYLAKDTARANIKMETLKLYQEVFQLHHVTREEFSKSFTWYRERPDLTRGLFDSLLAKGNRLRTESYSKPQPAAPTPAPPLTPTTVNPGKGRIPGAPIRPGSLIRPGSGNIPGSPHGFPPGTPGKGFTPQRNGIPPSVKPPAHFLPADSAKRAKGFIRPLQTTPKP